MQRLRPVQQPFRRFKADGLRAQSCSFASTAREHARDVRLVEVGPRDGLQNEKTSIPASTKTELIHRLVKTGVHAIEGGSFVSPKWVPQMADSSDILANILEQPTDANPVDYHWLVPNEKGLDNFLSAYNARARPIADGGSGLESRHEVAVFAAATETFSKRNTNRSVDETLAAFKPLISRAHSQSLRVRAYISVALGCPYEGPNVSPHVVAQLATSLLELGADSISVADTTGMGTAPRTAELLKTLHAAGVKNEDLAMHFHDTYGQALVNALVSLEQGVTCFDSAVAGLGGCLYSPGATGNVSTEDLVCCLEGLGVRTGVNLEEVARVGDWISKVLERPNESRAGRAILAKL